jgi:hypothetical protein
MPFIVYLAIFVATLLSACTSLPAADSYLFPPDAPVGNESQAEWSRAWWQWAGSFEHDASPVADRTGVLCASRQSGPVWFLAGTYGTKRTVRTCRVPRGKYLYFPLINYVVMPSNARVAGCTAIMSEAARMTEHVSYLLLEIDGVRYPDLQGHRQATRGCFDMGALARPRIRVYPSAASGYYVMIKPLPPGQHILHFGGASPDMAQGVTYTIIVE